MVGADPPGPDLLQAGPRQLLLLHVLGRQHQGQRREAQEHQLWPGGAGGVDHQEEMEQSKEQDPQNGQRH